MAISGMPTLPQNLHTWAKANTWETRGDEWSETWGGPLTQWQEAILPRISAYLPVRHILEIAPGYGRWTQFLAAHVRRSPWWISPLGALRRVANASLRSTM